MEQVTTIRISTELRSTENIDKVKAAVKNIFPDAVFGDPEGGHIEAEAHDFSCFKDHIMRQRIRNAVRTQMRKGMGTDSVAFMLSKQAAFAGRVCISEGEGALGDIEVRISSEDPEHLVEEVTEKVDAKGVPDEYEGPGLGG